STQDGVEATVCSDINKSGRTLKQESQRPRSFSLEPIQFMPKEQRGNPNPAVALDRQVLAVGQPNRDPVLAYFSLYVQRCSGRNKAYGLRRISEQLAEVVVVAPAFQ